MKCGGIWGRDRFGTSAAGNDDRRTRAGKGTPHGASATAGTAHDDRMTPALNDTDKTLSKSSRVAKNR